MFAFHRRQARERRLHAEQRRVASVDAGDESVGQRLGDLPTRPAAHEVVDGFVGAVAARTTEALRQQAELRPPAEGAARQERPQAAGQLAQPALEEEEAVAARRLAHRNQAVAEAEFAAEIEHGGVRVEKAIGAGLHAEAVALKRPHLAAEARLPFEDDDRDVGQALLQAVGERQSGNAAADDDDARHVRFPWCRRLACDQSRRAACTTNQSHNFTLSSNRGGIFASTMRRTSCGW